MGPRDGGVSLSEHMVPDLLEVPRGPALRIRDDHGLVHEDRDPEGMEGSLADVQVAIHVLLDDRRQAVIASEELTRIRDPPVRFPDSDGMSFPLEMLLDRGEPVAELRRRQEADPFRQEGLRGVDEGHRGQRGAGEIVEEDAVVPKVRHRGVAQVDDEVHGHLSDVAGTERRVRGDQAGHARLGLDLPSEFDGLRAQSDRELETDRPGGPAANHFDEAFRVAHGGISRCRPREKGVPSGLPFLRLPLDFDPPGSREFHAPLPEGNLGVGDVVLRRRDREDLHAWMDARRGTDRAAEGCSHPFRDSVRAGSRRDLVLAEHVVRIQSELQVVRVAGLLRDVPVRGDARRLEGDVADLALLLRDQMDLHGEVRPQIADVKLADPDLGDSAHVALLGIRLSADLPIHAAGLARHGGRRSKGRALFNSSRREPPLDLITGKPMRRTPRPRMMPSRFRLGLQESIKSVPDVGRPTMLLVKLGGSVLTDKARLRTARPAAIRRLAGELASVAQPLLIVHGAGSYGHILASRYRLSAGGSSSAKRTAAARVQADVRALNHIVVDALNRVGFASIPIPPAAVLSLDDGRVSTIDLTPFLEFSSMGFTPVTFGDVVRDLRRGFSVCSGDLMMVELARAFRPKRAVFAADVDGLFTADPKRRKHARLLDVVGPKDLAQIEFSAPRTDVTGSIEGKLHRMVEIADHVDECLIVNGNVKNRVRDALRGMRVVGTRIVRGP